MIWLYGLTLTMWVAVFLYMLPAAWSIYIRQQRWGDPARLVCMLFALLQIGGLTRRVVVSEMAADAWMIGQLLASIGVAALTLKMAHSYGRGHRV